MSAMRWLRDRLRRITQRATHEVPSPEILLSQRRFRDALRTLQDELRQKPKHSASLQGLRTIAAQQEDPLAALDACLDLIVLHPAEAEIHYRLANALQLVNRHEEALRSYDAAITLSPNHSESLCNRGSVLLKLGRYVEALASFERALAVDATDKRSHFNRGCALLGLDRTVEAIDSLGRAIDLDPLYVDALFNRALAFHTAGEYERAIDGFDAAIARGLHRPDAFHTRGLAQCKVKKFAEAVASFNQAIALEPEFAVAHAAKGDCLREMGRHADAVEAYAEAIRLGRATGEVYEGIAFSLMSIGMIEKAIEAYDHALSVDRGRKYIFGMRFHAKMHICRWNSWQADSDELAAGLNSGKAVSMPFPVLGLTDSPELQRRAAKIFAAEECPASAELEPIPKRPRKTRMRIGYFSADFRPHPVALLAAGLFESHDRNRFEIFAFDFGPQVEDPIRERLRRAFDEFIDVRALSDVEIARLAREKEIDVAVDLGGYTVFSRPQIFAFRAAPVQLSYLGYLGTLGSTAIDYLIADETLVPVDCRQWYSEKIVYLPSYQANDSRREASARQFSRASLGLPERGFVYCCFNANYKITPLVFTSWMRILKRVPTSVLYLYIDNDVSRGNLRDEAERCGVAADRLVFGGRIGKEDYLARLRAMDLFLDTLPYNAGTTASDALWAGLPVVTLAGNGLAARMAASLLVAIDLPELVTTSREHYEDLAVQMAQDPSRMERIRRHLIQNRGTSRLFNTAAFARSIERAYDSTFGRWSDGLTRDHVTVGERLDHQP